MGQYHDTFALPQFPNEKAQSFSHYALSGGAKLCEQYYTWRHDPDYEYGGPPPKGPLLASPCAAAVALMVTMGSWSKRPIITVGDYHEGEHAELYGSPPELVQDITAEVTALTSEAFGFSYTSDGNSPWLELSIPEDFKYRVDRMNAMHVPDWDLVLVATAGHSGEYLRPTPFLSVPHPVASCLLGGLWPTALLMTAVSDGLGGGDANMRPAGRWAGATFAWVSRNRADEVGAEDVTDWALEQSEVSSHVLSAT